jgi:hypothetical protein
MPAIADRWQIRSPVREDSMRPIRLIACLMTFLATPAAASDISPEGARLASALDEMHVARLWLADRDCDWQTGEAKGGRTSAKVPHSASFVAAASERLGVYILRPPHHALANLGNAQFDWLHSKDAHKQGWHEAKTAEEAQRLANHGQLVVVVWKNHLPGHIGHVAIVRPARHGQQHLHDFGPEIIQAGLENYTSTSVSKGFSHHPTAWGNREVWFFAHRIEWLAENR